MVFSYCVAMQIDSTSFIREKLCVGLQYSNDSTLIDGHIGKELKCMLSCETIQGLQAGEGIK